ncbi:MAG: DUF72 domain-containing protein [Dokdonella sp.]|uniref:DUF72 domain-containing protein n=1 Tax=Dokdonella sp. TaxID=2291710 RepID=UPI003264A6EF
MTRCPVRIGCAGWSLPGNVTSEFPHPGTHLERYAAVFNAVEINSSFYRAHRASTYARWACSVPQDFRFSVKVPKAITHDLRLKKSTQPLTKFLHEVDSLGDRLGSLLIQLPPSLAFDDATVEQFLTSLRRMYDGPAVIEPRHVSWFQKRAEQLLSAFDTGRVGADPPVCDQGAWPLASAKPAYVRLHGTPTVYVSNYDDGRLIAVARELDHRQAGGQHVWCIFDNTSRGFATQNARTLQRLLTLLNATPTA